MSLKPWIVKLIDGSLYSFRANHRPVSPRYLDVFPGLIDPLTGSVEEGVWLQLENIEDPDNPGVFILTATVNEVLKASILAGRLADETAKNDAKKIKDDLFKADKKALKAIKLNKLNTAEEIRNAIITLKDMMVKIEEALLNVDENA